MQKPYLTRTTTVRLLNPEYDQQARCVCGHTYERHFDTHDYPADSPECVVGCKYCGCNDFCPAAEAPAISVDDLNRIRNASDASPHPDAMSYVRKLLLEVDRLRAVAPDAITLRATINALRYIAAHGKPVGIADRYNAAQLFKLANELESKC